MFKFSKLRLQPLDVRGTEGDRLELNCQARGSPPPRCCLDLITSLTMAISLLAGLVDCLGKFDQHQARGSPHPR